MIIHCSKHSKQQQQQCRPYVQQRHCAALKHRPQVTTNALVCMKLAIMLVLCVAHRNSIYQHHQQQQQPRCEQLTVSSTSLCSVSLL
jgi:hypothetical protein